MIGKRKTSHVWSFFGQMTTTILGKQFAVRPLPFSEIGTKSKTTGISTRATFGSRLFVDHFAALCRVVFSRPLGKVRCRSSTTLKKVLHMLFMREDQISNPLQCLYYNAPSVGGTKWNRSRAVSTKAILSCSQKKINDRCLRKSIYNLHVA